MTKVYKKWDGVRTVYTINGKEYIFKATTWAEVDRSQKGEFGELMTKDGFVDRDTTHLLNYAGRIGWSTGSFQGTPPCEVIEEK